MFNPKSFIYCMWKRTKGRLFVHQHKSGPAVALMRQVFSEGRCVKLKGISNALCYVAFSTIFLRSYRSTCMQSLKYTPSSSAYSMPVPNIKRKRKVLWRFHRSLCGCHLAERTVHHRHSRCTPTIVFLIGKTNVLLSVGKLLEIPLLFFS